MPLLIHNTHNAHTHKAARCPPRAAYLGEHVLLGVHEEEGVNNGLQGVQYGGRHCVTLIHKVSECSHEGGQEPHRVLQVILCIAIEAETWEFEGQRRMTQMNGFMSQSLRMAVPRGTEVGYKQSHKAGHYNYYILLPS